MIDLTTICGKILLKDVSPGIDLYCPLPKDHEGYHSRSDDPSLEVNQGNGQV